MLPVALGSGDGSEWRRPMAVISIGGLATSTLLTLLVVPIFYTFVAQAHDVLASAARRVLAALRAAAGRAPGPPPAQPDADPPGSTLAAPGASISQLPRDRSKPRSARRGG
jgi:hypothetical protein